MDVLFVVITREQAFEWVHEVKSVEVTIGRNEDCELRLRSPHVSRNHAMIVNLGGNFVIRDLGSRNGTFLNGLAVVRDEILNNGDQLGIGPFDLSICANMAQAMMCVPNAEESTLHRRDNYVNGAAFPETLRLTTAQRRVFDLFLQGHLEKEVAKLLQISINTVHDHAKVIYKTLSVSTRSELLSRFIRQRDG